MERHRDYYGDYQEPQWNPQLATSSWPSVDHFPHYDNYVGGGFPENGNHHYHYHHQDGRHENQYRRQHHYNNFGSGPNDSISGGGDEAGPGQSLPFSGRKRPFPHSVHDAPPDCKGVGSVKLYVGGIPRTVTEEDVRNVFEEHGNVVEVVFIKDKRTGQQQECCFVKYGTLEEADRAIGALNFQYTFYGVSSIGAETGSSMLPIKVRYADKERERIGINASGVGNPQASSGVFGAHVHKLYVGCLNKQAAMKDIEEIFSPYGLVKDVYIVRDELKQSRGCAFVLFSQRDMAVAAISELNGKYFTGVCDHPLVVKFAEPRKPRDGEARPSAYHTDSIARPPLSNIFIASGESKAGIIVLPNTAAASATSPDFLTRIGQLTFVGFYNYQNHIFVVVRPGFAAEEKIRWRVCGRKPPGNNRMQEGLVEAS
ncbi:hypothetical protein RJ640_021714 [Escallonia rubra]|uniref:RRM domain-containing protein n=1 Tax=Escallonia rubra TaxID=112253 RepID=A0AA88U2V8_9ASTE|nr:hypothetical protein RJ640_021714 [Escallonia rubra]